MSKYVIPKKAEKVQLTWHLSFFTILGAETDMCRNRKLPKKLLSISTEEPHRLFIVGKRLGGGLPPGCVIQVGVFGRMDKSPFVGVEDGSRQIEISGLGDTIDTVDGSEIRQTHQLRLVVEIPLCLRVLYIPGGCFGFLNHQQYQPTN